MTAIAPGAPSASIRSSDIDLNRYLNAIRRRWRLAAMIAILVILVTAAATIALATFDSRYTGESSLLLVGNKYQLAFEPKITTVDILPNSQTSQASRIDEYKAIALGTETRRALIRANPDVFPDGKLTMELDARVKGALVGVMVTGSDPAEVTKVSRTYAEIVANRLDAVYGQSDTDRTVLDKQLADAITAADTADARLADYYRTSRIDDLKSQISYQDAIRLALVDDRGSAIRSGVTFLETSLIDLDRLRRDAAALRQQVERGTESPASMNAAAIAIIGLQSRLTNLAPTIVRNANDADKAGTLVIPGGVEGPRVTVQLDANATQQGLATRDRLVSDIDVVLSIVDIRQAETQRAIVELAEAAIRQPQDGTLKLVNQVTNDLNRLRSELRLEESKRDGLLASAASARAARESLEKKSHEAAIAATATNGKAIIVSTAPDNPTRTFPPPLSRTIPSAIPVGILLGVAVSLLIELYPRRRLFFK